MAHVLTAFNSKLGIGIAKYKSVAVNKASVQDSAIGFHLFLHWVMKECRRSLLVHKAQEEAVLPKSTS